ncbi:MAG: hypothetical protein QXK48_03850, partial [Candidatus Aenigmatarchaeota archaeon]
MEKKLVLLFFVLSLILFLPSGKATIYFASGTQSPANLTQRDDFHPYLNASIQVYSDSSLTINCSLYVDDILNQTVDDVSNNTFVYLNSSELSFGDHNWYINCTDDNWVTQSKSEVRIVGIGSNFSRCAILSDSYANYYLTQDVIDSSATVCIDITANNITLDCQGHTIDGKDTSNTYGIRISRSSTQATNITIRNCIVTDWSSGIYLYQ